MSTTRRMTGADYQLGFSTTHAEPMYDVKGRRQKAEKVLAVLNDYFQRRHVFMAGLTLLDVGSSTGFYANSYAAHFKSVIGLDIDRDATSYAVRTSANRASFLLADSMNIPFAADTFDVITCTHVYEHVPDSNRLMEEVWRVLKPGGICYFAAGNRLKFIEGHYHLPFLSVIPKPWANHYLRLLGRGQTYYETHLAPWQLRRLVRRFEVIDYTRRIIAEPQRFSAGELLMSGSHTQRWAAKLSRPLYWLIPTYHWLLRKPKAT